jgi:tRNA pseudouridine38-40 synthase
VHALGQVAACSLARDLDPATLARALNARLPPEVRVLSAVEVAATFHPRFGARSKVYRYRIWNADVASPFERRYAWHFVETLDVDAMTRAAGFLEGAHDFAAFQAAGSETRTTERTILSLRIGDRGSLVAPDRHPRSALIVLDIVGEGFLRHMVRVIVGSLVEVGRGRRAPEWIGDVLASRDRAMAGPTAPPHGLFLASVDYTGALADEP